MSDKTHTHTILLVDDDNAVRRLCRIILEQAGFAVIEADSAESALRLWATCSESVDLLVTDYHMMGLTGLQLAVSLRSSKPDLGILLISGGAIQESVPMYIGFLAKPFPASSLTQAVSKALAS